MSDRRANTRLRQCPCVNRMDTRCGEHFGLNMMSFALDHCFGDYDSCPVFRQMLEERLIRRTGDRHAIQLVQISLPDRYQKPAA